MHGAYRFFCKSVIPGKRTNSLIGKKIKRAEFAGLGQQCTGEAGRVLTRGPIGRLGSGLGSARGSWACWRLETQELRLARSMRGEALGRPPRARAKQRRRAGRRWLGAELRRAGRRGGEVLAVRIWPGTGLDGAGAGTTRGRTWCGGARGHGERSTCKGEERG